MSNNLPTNKLIFFLFLSLSAFTLICLGIAKHFLILIISLWALLPLFKKIKPNTNNDRFVLAIVIILFCNIFISILMSPEYENLAKNLTFFQYFFLFLALSGSFFSVLAIVTLILQRGGCCCSKDVPPPQNTASNDETDEN